VARNSTYPESRFEKKKILRNRQYLAALVTTAKVQAELAEPAAEGQNESETAREELLNGEESTTEKGLSNAGGFGKTMD
jgi:hypothetical protein